MLLFSGHRQRGKQNKLLFFLAGEGQRRQQERVFCWGRQKEQQNNFSLAGTGQRGQQGMVLSAKEGQRGSKVRVIILLGSGRVFFFSPRKGREGISIGILFRFGGAEEEAR